LTGNIPHNAGIAVDEHDVRLARPTDTLRVGHVLSTGGKLEFPGWQ
jgi:hypothetical protein